MSRLIDVLLVEPGKRPHPTQTGDSIESFERILGGPVEIGCFLPQKVFLVSWEKALQPCLTPNRVNPATKECIYGPFLLCGLSEDGGQFTSLSPEQQAAFAGIFARPQEFIRLSEKVYADPDDLADAVYALWDSMKDGEIVALKKYGMKEQDTGA